MLSHSNFILSPTSGIWVRARGKEGSTWLPCGKGQQSKHTGPCLSSLFQELFCPRCSLQSTWSLGLQAAGILLFAHLADSTLLQLSLTLWVSYEVCLRLLFNPYLNNSSFLWSVWNTICFNYNKPLCQVQTLKYIPLPPESMSEFLGPFFNAAVQGHLENSQSDSSTTAAPMCTLLSPPWFLFF